MARTRKSIQALNLYKYDVLIEDKGTRSDYFRVTQFDGYFYGGRNAFLIAGTSVLKPNSKILVEVLNVNNETIFSAPISNFIEGSSRLIQVEIYGDTPPGPAKLVVLGSTETYIDGNPIPSEWKDKYNVRWITDVIISPRINNKTPIRFQTTPSIFVKEKFYTTPSSSQFTETISVPVDVELSPKYFNVFPNGYILSLKGPTQSTFFTNEYIGGKLSGSIAFTGSFGIETAIINLPITKIYNKNTAESNGTLIYTTNNTLITNAYLSASGNYSSSVNLGINSIVNSKLDLVYSELDSQLTGSNISFAEVRLVDLGTLSGEINKVRLSFKKSTSPGEYTVLGDVDTGVKELFAIDSGSSVVDTGDFTKIDLNTYWYTATMSLQKNETSPSIPTYYLSSSLVSNTVIYKNNNDILNAISATPVITGGDFIDGKAYFIGTSNINSAELFPRSEYTLAFNAFASRTSSSISLSQDDYSLEVYLVPQETSNSNLLTINPLGQLIGTLTPSTTFQKQNFERVELNFTPQIITSGEYGIRFVVYGGHWSISDVSLKVAQEQFFSPDEINLLLPIENNEQDILTFKAEFLDVDNNTAGISAFSIPTYFTGSSDYVKKSGDYMTGELYINGLPMQQQALQDGFTGLVSGGVITVNTPASWSYTISSGSGYVIDNYTNPLSPSYTYVTWPEISKMPAAFTTTGSVASYPRTNIAISASGQIIEQSAEWTPQDYRRYIILGRIAHVGTTFIQRALSLPLTTYNRGFHWFDLANAIGILNVEGNVFYPSGSSMSIGKTAGKTYRVGSNYRNDTTFPDITTDPVSLPTTFAYRFRSGSGFKEDPLTTIVSGNLYDDGSGVLQTVNPNKFTVQRIYYFGATNTTRIQFGQTVYDTLVDAQSSADAEIFVADPNLERDSSLRAYLIVGSSATNLSNPADAEFITIGKFGAGGTGGGGGGGATALSGLTDVNLSGPTSGQLLQYNGSVWVNGTNVAILATTGSNNFLGTQTITGSLIVSGSSTLTNIGPAIFSGSFVVSGSATSSFRVDSDRTTVSGSASFSGPIAGTHAVFSQMYNENATLAGVYLGRNISDNTPRVGFFNGTTAQNWQIDNSAGQFRWYTPGVTRMTLTTSGTSTVLRLLGASSVITSEGSISASRGITGSLQGTSSFASTSSALIGGTTNYIPVWSSPSVVSSSTIFQLGGNIGIGTTNPDSLLHIASPSTLNWKLQNTGGGGSTVASYAGVGTGSIGTLTNHAFFVYTNNTERMRFDIAGNAGIGTTSPAARLDVNGGIAIGGGNVISASATYTQLFRRDGDIGIYLGGNADPGNYYDNTNHYFRDRSSNIRWQINSSGHIVAGTDIAYDIGASGATRPRSVYVGTSTIIGNDPGGSEPLRVGGIARIAGDIYLATSAVATITTTNNQALRLGTNNQVRVHISESGQVGIGTTTPRTLLHVSGSTTFDASVLERATVSATAANGTINFDVNTQAVLFYTTNASGNWTLNVRGSSTTSLNSLLVTGQAITIVFLVTNGGTAYYPTSHTIDGVSVTPKWQGGVTITSGNPNAIDVYAYSIIKTADATFTVLASQTNFA